jgi:hypothetical protein
MYELKYKIDTEIIPEFSPEAAGHLEYVWIEYDLDEELKKADLNSKLVQLGVKTPEMVAHEMNINFEEVKKYQEEQKKEMMEQQAMAGKEDPKQPNSPAENNVEGALQRFKDKYVGTKSQEEDEPELEKKLTAQIEQRGKQILTALQGLKV